MTRLKSVKRECSKESDFDSYPLLSTLRECKNSGEKCDLGKFIIMLE